MCGNQTRIVRTGDDKTVCRDRNGLNCSAWAEDVMVGEDYMEKEYTGDHILPDVASLAKHLGIRKDDYPSMLWIAQAALRAPIPPDWTECSNQKGEIFYYNSATKDSSWEHPIDGFFRILTERYQRSLQQQ